MRTVLSWGGGACQEPIVSCMGNGELHGSVVLVVAVAVVVVLVVCCADVQVMRDVVLALDGSSQCHVVGVGRSFGWTRPQRPTPTKDRIGAGIVSSFFFAHAMGSRQAGVWRGCVLGG